MKLNNFSNIDASIINKAANEFGTPLYLYDEAHIIKRCRDCREMPDAFGVTVHYAMKANSNRTILKLINDMGLHMDASSLNEVTRAELAGIPYERIMLTTQEVYDGAEMDKLKGLLLKGLKYNVSFQANVKRACPYCYNIFFNITFITRKFFVWYNNFYSFCFVYFYIHPLETG